MTLFPSGTHPRAPAQLADPPPARRNPILAAAALVALIVTFLFLPDRDALGRSLPVSLALGAAFGAVVQRSRFCFWCNLRDWFQTGDPRGVLGILAALAVGAIGYSAILGVWVPNPVAGRLPPDAHVGPVSITLAVGAFVFGLGMAISGSCVSAHLYRLGEGALGSVIALIGVLGGFVLGFLSWNSLYLIDLHRAQAWWLPGLLGHSGSLALTLAVLAGLFWLLRRGAGGQFPLWQAAPGSGRWPAITGGIMVGWIATLAYFRVGPLGVTAEIGSIARTAAASAELLPETLFGLDGMAGCATVIKETLLSRNGVFVLGLVLASAITAGSAGDWRPVWPDRAGVVRLFAGGLMLGWGAMVSLGCTVGVLLSGIMAGAVAGWVFLAACLAGAWAGWRLRR